jgi:hypothetical protein
MYLEKVVLVGKSEHTPILFATGDYKIGRVAGNARLE